MCNKILFGTLKANILHMFFYIGRGYQPTTSHYYINIAFSSSLKWLTQFLILDYFIATMIIIIISNKHSSGIVSNSFNFWIHSVIIKLLPCLVLTVISFILIRVLCQAAKRKVKLKGYNQTASASNVNAALNGHR